MATPQPRVCLACGEDLPSWARIDKTTCSTACRTRLSRLRTAPRNTFETPLGSVAPRSGGVKGREPVGGQIAPLTASGTAPVSMFATPGESKANANPRATNSLILALVVALRDVEARRIRGNVVTETIPKEPNT